VTAPPLAGVAIQPHSEPDRASSDRTPSDHATSDHAASDHAASDHAASDHAASDHAASDRAASDNAASDNAASDNAASDHAASDNAVSDNAASDHAHGRGRALAGPLEFGRALGARLVAAPRWAAWALVVGWYGLIWTLSSRPGGVEPWSPIWAVISNSAHAPLFGLWAAWLCLLAPRVGRWPALTSRTWAAIVATVAAFGLLDEIHQHLFSPGRDFSLFDLATDVTGAALALHLVRYLGAPGADSAGAWRRLALAACGSFAAGAVATYAPRCFHDVWWL